MHKHEATTPMKKFVTLITVLILATSIAYSGASTFIMKELIAKIMEAKVEDILSKEIVAKAVDGAFKAADYDITTPSSYIGYYGVRDAVFQQEVLGGGYNGLYTLETKDANPYTVMRTLVIAKMKEHLHQGDNLINAYQVNRGAVQAKFATLKPEEKVRARIKIALAIDTFMRLKDPTEFNRFRDMKMAEQMARSAHWADLELLAKNLSTAEVAKEIEAGALEVKPLENTSAFEDQYLAEFAARRYNEGGSNLLDKYISVLKLLA